MNAGSYTVTCDACPHQVEGELSDGRWFYFRARHHHWELHIGKTLDDALDNNPIAQGQDPDGNLSYGDAPDAARTLIETIISIIEEKP